MTRRSAQLWMRSLLPLLVLRLLLPTGVMPVASAHGIALVPCGMDLGPMAMPGPMDMQHAMDMRGSMAMDDAGAAAPAAPAPDQSTARKDTICPFAAAATLAPVSAKPLTALQLLATSTLVVVSQEPQRTAQSGPLRTQLSRAPPAFS